MSPSFLQLIHTQALLAAFAFSSIFVFRPWGALLFGYIGDTYGRKITLVITTFMTTLSCLIMANVPTYAQIRNCFEHIPK